MQSYRVNGRIEVRVKEAWGHGNTDIEVAFLSVNGEELVILREATLRKGDAVQVFPIWMDFGLPEDVTQKATERK